MDIGLKFNREANESSTNFQIIKDSADPNFASRETEAMFILTARLKGYKRRNLSIDINEDGTLLSISCERRVKETTMVGQKLYKKEIMLKGFKKVFRIPDCVDLDNIEAKCDEEESILTITMPKKVKGLKGTVIEEIKENEEVIDEKIRATDSSSQEKIAEEEEQDNQNRAHEIASKRNEEEENKASFGIQESVSWEESKDESFKICTPIIAGSALLLSLVAFVVHIIRNKNQSNRRSD